MARSKIITRTCELCKKTFSPFANSLGKYCTRQCYNATRRASAHGVQLLTGTCGFCGAEFRTPAYRIRQGIAKYCSGACKAAANSKSLFDRFSAKIFKQEAGCWLWKGHVNAKGYGVICKDGQKMRTKLFYAHRVSWEMRHGPVPTGLSVLHKCDNPPCVNPDHLFLGTPADNSADMVSKNRQCKGEFHVAAKLTPAKVIAIVSHFNNGLTRAELAQQYGVSRSTISDILCHRTWKYITHR